ncbi:hypothetical protein HWI79_2652 [Cryptosporidium felis]|nr:hypothetical protein HWI79_2652 [Cryptosporidium felis]
MSYSSKNKFDDFDQNRLGFAGIWPLNGKDTKVVPMGTPGVPLTDIYDEMMHSNGCKKPQKPVPIGDHSYPIPVPVPIITPRTRDIAQSVIQNGTQQAPGKQSMMNSATLKPKRRSFESLKNKSQPPQYSVSSSKRLSSRLGSSSNEPNRQKSSTNTVQNRRSLASIPSSVNTPINSRQKISINESSQSIPIGQRRSNSVTPLQRNSHGNVDYERYKIPEDYLSKSNTRNNHTFNSNAQEYPTVPYPCSIDNDDEYFKQDLNNSRLQNVDNFLEEQIPFESNPQRRTSTRRTTQNSTSSANYRNFAAAKSSIPHNSNLSHPKNYSNFGNSHYKQEEFYPAHAHGRSSSLGRPTFTNNTGFNPLESCIPNSPNQYNANPYNCYSVPNKYRNSVHDIIGDDDYLDTSSCFSPSRTLMHCSGDYGTLEADRHIKQNYSSADEVFKPMVYETIVFPPGYFEYKKQLEELRKKYLFENNPSAYYQMKQNGEFGGPNNRNGCMWTNNKNRKNRKSHPIFVKTTGTVGHLSRERPGPACYC